MSLGSLINRTGSGTSHSVVKERASWLAGKRLRIKGL